MTATATISVVMVKNLLHALGVLSGRLNYDTVLSKHCFEPSVLEDDDNRLPIHIFYELVTAEAKRLNDPVLGLKTGQIVGLKNLKWIYDLFFFGTDGKDAIRTFNRYHQTYIDVFKIDIKQQADGWIWTLNAPQFNEIPYHFIDAIMIIMSRSAEFSGSQGILSVDFSHPCPQGCEAIYEHHFKTQVNFNQSQTCFQLCNEWLDRDISHFDFPTYQKLVGSEKRYAKTKGNRSLVDQVRFILGRMLFTGDVSTRSMANAMGIPLRTFQRRLKENDISYKDLVEDTRKSLAMEYLAAGECPINEIAFLVGYSEGPNFFRAFKSWTGMSPLEYREQHLVSK